MRGLHALSYFNISVDPEKTGCILDHPEFPQELGRMSSEPWSA